MKLCAKQLIISNLSYGQSSFSFNSGQAITSIKPTYDGIIAKSFSISPAFSNGLKFNTSTGEISGTPTSSLQPTQYTITGTNSYGSASVSISIEVIFLQVNHKATGTKFPSVTKLFNPVIDPVKKRLYVDGSKTGGIAVIDLTTDKVIQTIDMGLPGGGFLVFDSNYNLYQYTFGNSEACFAIDVNKLTTTKVLTTTCQNLVPEIKNGLYYKNLRFQMTGYSSHAYPNGNSGFPINWRQDLSASYGVIDIYDSANVKKGEILSGVDSLYMAIDQTTGKLYTSATGNAMISIFDLNKLSAGNFCQYNSCWVKDIDTGTVIDQIIVDSSNNMYIRNRLNGSTIYKYNLSSKAFSIINNEYILSGGKAMFNNDHAYPGIAMWPTGMELSLDEKRLYVLSHYGALIDVVDTQTNAVKNRIKFTTDLKPRTDGISTMAIDKTRDRLYAAFPELGIIGVTNSSTVLATIDLTKYGFDKIAAANGGPGIINLAVSEALNKLFVYFSGKLVVFNGDTFIKENETVTSTAFSGKELLLKINDAKNEIYVGNLIIDIISLAQKGTLLKGEKVVDFNNADNSIYTWTNYSSDRKWYITVYKLVNNVSVQEWNVNIKGEVLRPYLDFKNKKLFIFDFSYAIIMDFNL